MMIKPGNRETKGSKKTARIVLIDDSDEITLFIVSTLYEFEVISFQNPMQSYSALDETDLLILDYDLPEISGLDFMRYIRENHPGIPVIMITGQGSEDVCQLAFRLGVKDYIKKPFLAMELREIVYRLLGEHLHVKDGARKRKKEIPSAVLNKLYKAKHYIDKNIDDNVGRGLKLDEVLKHVGMSKTPFVNYFKTLFGKTFRAYLMEKKIEKAKELLREGETVSRVGEMLGFSDISYFSKMFKKFTNSLPSQYRDTYRDTP